MQEDSVQKGPKTPLSRRLLMEGCSASVQAKSRKMARSGFRAT